MDSSIKTSDPRIIQHENAEGFFPQLGQLFILASIFFLNFIARITLAPLIPDMETDLNMTHADAGALFFIISLGYFTTLSVSGYFSSRLNHKQTIIISNTALGLALIGTAFCAGLWTLRLGLFIVGMAAGLYLPSAIATLTALISSQHWGKALAIHDIAPNFSFVAAPLISETIMLWFSWRVVFFLLGFAALVMSPVFARFGRGGKFLGDPPSFLSFRELLTNSSVWVIVILFSLGISSTLGLFTMLPLYLVAEHGIDRNVANILVALSRISGLVMAFVGGWATDRFGPKRTLIAIFIVVGLMTILLGTVPSSWIPLIVFLQPLIAVCFFPAGFTALSLIVPPKSRNIAVSLTIPTAFLVGAGLVPTLIGYIGEVRSFALGIALTGGLILTGSILVGHLKFYHHIR